MIDSGLISRSSCLDSEKKDASDFDVKSILKKHATTLENIAPSRTFSMSYDAYFEEFRKRPRRFQPSGLIKSDNNWQKRLAELEKRPTRGIVASEEEVQRTLVPTQIVSNGDASDVFTSINYFCANCKKFVQTLVTYKKGRFTYLAAFICCFIL